VTAGREENRDVSCIWRKSPKQFRHVSAARSACADHATRQGSPALTAARQGNLLMATVRDKGGGTIRPPIPKPARVRADNPSRRNSAAMTFARACLFAAIIICGLALRGLGLRVGLPAFIVKYGGSVLWARWCSFW
jgi:hypothetical protein